MRRSTTYTLSLIILLALAAWSLPATAEPSGGMPEKSQKGGNGPPSGEVLEVRVMSYNIRHGRGMDGVVDLERIARVLEGSGADVVGLQEVDDNWGARSGFEDQPTWLAERLGMHVVYGPNLQEVDDDGEPRRYGNAILSRHPIVSASNTPLPNHGSEQRGAQEVVVEIGSDEVRVVNTHLTHIDTDGTERDAQVEALADIVTGSTLPTVLTGDLNTASPRVLEPVLEVVEDPQDSFTTSAATYPADDPRIRLDYVFATSDLRAVTSHVVATEASDHRPVVTDWEADDARGNGPR